MPQPKPLELTPEQIARVERTKRQNQGVKVSPEEVFVAEFGYYFGWQGVEAILDNQIDIETANGLLVGAQKVWYTKLIEQSYAIYTANSASQSGKKGRQIMQKGLKEFVKQAKADT